MFRHRSVIEIMVIVFTFVIALSIMATGVVVGIIEVRDPKADTSVMTRALTTIITLILGSLLGLLAGKTTAVTNLAERPPEEKDAGQHRREGEEEDDGIL